MKITQQAVERAKDLIAFIDDAPTAYQAAEVEKFRLEKEGFHALAMDERWDLQPESSYYVEISDATLIAFRTGKRVDSGFRVIGAHNDSPSLQLKHNVNVYRNGYAQLNVEPYGGLIMRTWLDRPLSIAGRVIVREDSPKGYATRKVKIDRPLLIIPSLAIHMDREVNQSGKIQPQDMLAPVWGLGEEGEKDFLNIIAKEMGIAREDILDYDLFLYDVEKGTLIGAAQDMISIGRLDNLAMCHAAITSLMEAEAGEFHQVIALHDHEEIGSMSRKGADSATLRDVLSRIIRALGGDRETESIAYARSFMISCDMAHAVHPNYSSVSDPTNRPILNGGPVIKYAAAKSYITDGEGGAKIRLHAEKENIPLQTFFNHSDKRGGATIGSMDEQWTTILNADMGNPLLGMHSVRELGGVADHDAMICLLTSFLNDGK